jgi:DNA polymerase-1
MPRVHLIDAHLYVFRAYAALPEMRAPDGTCTQAAYGFASTLIRILGEAAPKHVACAFDHALTSFRNEIEPGYKAGRTEPPPDLEPQFALCAEVAESLGMPALSAPGFEADDVIATLAEALVAAGAEVVVVSADKDLAQLVREDGRVLLWDFARARTLDADGVRARFGVAPQQIPDYLGLVGDAVDNLPGVPGVGPKSAAAALRAFGTIEAIPHAADAWAGIGIRGAARIAARIEAHRERALRSRALATLRRDVPGLAVGPEAFAWRGADRGRAERLCRRLGWGRIAERIPSTAPA